MSKITYTDKVALNINQDVADINKCNATDLNEIKNVVNENDDNVGNLEDLETTDKSSIVNAINEVTQPRLTLLYEGEWNNGNITLSENITNFTNVYILMKGQGTYINCPILPVELALNKTTGYVRGADGYTSGANCYTFHFNATFQYTTPNILTFVACQQVQHLTSGNHSAYIDNIVAKIIGVK